MKKNECQSSDKLQKPVRQHATYQDAHNRKLKGEDKVKVADTYIKK